MTHDELLAKFKDLKPESKGWNALRAVVELHFNDNGQCYVCRHEWDWPCETIQAIEKELQ